MTTEQIKAAAESDLLAEIMRTSIGAICVLNPTRDLVDHMSADFDMLIVQLEGPALRLVLAEDFGITARQSLEFLPGQRPPNRNPGRPNPNPRR